MTPHTADDWLMWKTDAYAPGSKEHNEPEAGPSGTYRPIIGIPLPIAQGAQGPLLLADAVSVWAVERMRARVFLIPLWPFPTHKHLYQSLWPLMHSMDGLLLPAGLSGTDWNPLWNKDECQKRPEHWSLAWEIALAQLATYLGMPLLAIGDGAEKWNCALGGTRGEAMEEQRQSAPTSLEDWERYRVYVRAHSQLASFLQPALMAQASEPASWELAFMPGQGIEHLAPGLRSCAQSEETSLVAFERRDGAFGLGILGRLDWGLDQIYTTALFEAFLHACRSFDRTRQHQQSWESSRESICETVATLVASGQSLILGPRAVLKEPRQRSGSLAASTTSVHPLTGSQERLRPRAPTKEELNKVRRQRLKVTTR